MKKSILVIDDDLDIQKLCRVNLEFEGYAVSTVSSGDVGLQTAMDIVPDLILLDLKMPGTSGLMVLQTLKSDEKTADIPVVLISGLAQNEVQMSAWTSGCVDYIVKPFNPALLSVVVASALARKDNPEDDERRRRRMLEDWRLRGGFAKEQEQPHEA